ncbi:MAG: tetratricopeptide repeat protein [Myxococcales bacterium]|nr:tetratricopeptide repeat protein [Myxococcales bacterium]
MSIGVHVFVTHAPPHAPLVAELRQLLQERGVVVWQAATEVAAGSQLPSEVQNAIAVAQSVLVVLGPETANFPQVRRELRHAIETAARCADQGYRVIPLLLSGLEPTALELWFESPPEPIVVPSGPSGLGEVLPAIWAALGKALPEPLSPAVPEPPPPVEDLVLLLRDPALRYPDGKRMLSATAELIFEPAVPTAAKVESPRYRVQAPLGPIEADDLRWYLEEYYRWPFGLFRERARTIEAKLPAWGNELYQMALGGKAPGPALSAWQHAAERGVRRFSVHVDQDLPEGASADERRMTREAAAAWLTLPWELLHDGRSFLFQGALPVRVRRRLPNRDEQPHRVTNLPIRVLLLSPRPEVTDSGDPVGLIDPRASAKPLVEAIETLGELVQLSRLDPPTLSALNEALLAARKRGQPVDVVHFDGHGAWSKQAGLGGLYFERAEDAALPERRRADFVDAERLAGLFRQHRVPLVFLEACQTAQATDDPTASVAARLLQAGTASVVAMSHAVLVATARRFVQAFYRSLAQGERVGEAMLAGQRSLHDDPSRGQIPGAGPLQLADWFVPVLYQDRHDPQLVPRVPSAQVQRLAAERRRVLLGDVPPEPPHGFHGRRHELLRLERLLFVEPRWVVLTGIGGYGKTALSCELARWLLQSRRLTRAAFVSLERYQGVDSVLDTLGHQLLPQGKGFSVRDYEDLAQARLPVERALREAERGAILVLDNVESLLAGDDEPSRSALPGILTLLHELLLAAPKTRLVFSSRSPLPAPFSRADRHVELSALARPDAIDLVRQVLTQQGAAPTQEPDGSPGADVVALVESVRCHPRALVLLAGELAQRGLRAITADLGPILADLDRRHPGDRENSLYASVELSLRRLPPDIRDALTPLAVCHGGIHLGVLAMLSGLDKDRVAAIAAALIHVGLGEDLGDGHLRLDPGLPPHLLRRLPPGTIDQIEPLRARFAQALAAFATFLYERRSTDSEAVSRLTRHELANLLAMLTWHAQHAPPEQTVDLAHSVEGLVAGLGLRQALDQAVALRERASHRLGHDWSHSRFLSEGAAIDRLLDRGALPEALAAAQRLLRHCQAAGPTAYPEAPYDLAQASFKLGRVLQRCGQPEAALPPLTEAQAAFQALADAGNQSAAAMASTCLTDSANCLLDLGRYEDAARAYAAAIAQAEAADRQRQVAVGKGQLGMVRLQQKRYPEALALYQEARERFTRLGEPRSVAVVWHQIGHVLEGLGQLERAESAYRESLAIQVRENNLAGQASSLNQLGTLYDRLGRLEDAAGFYQQAASIYQRLGDEAHEGRAQNNLAHALIKLGRYPAARTALQRALQCKQPLGHAAEPWTTWDILCDLETVTGDPAAAQDARAQAQAAYLRYRRDGGESQSNRAPWFAAVPRAIRSGQAQDGATQLAGLRQADVPPRVRALITALLAVLHGDRRPALADDPDLDYVDAVELRLLLAALAAG